MEVCNLLVTYPNNVLPYSSGVMIIASVPCQNLLMLGGANGLVRHDTPGSSIILYGKKLIIEGIVIFERNSYCRLVIQMFLACI